MPFLETYPHDLKIVVADARYGSEENLLRLDESNVNYLIKYAMFDKEQKKAYKQLARNLSNWHYHDQRRSCVVVQEFLGDYNRFVYYDMWSAYRQLPNVKLFNCWAHGSQKFFEATPKEADLSSLGLSVMRCFALRSFGKS